MLSIFNPATVNFNKLSAELIRHIYSFLDAKSQLDFAHLRSKNPALWKYLLQLRMQAYFLESVVWAKPPKYKLKRMEESEWQPLILEDTFYFMLTSAPCRKRTHEKSGFRDNTFQLKYAVINPEGKRVEGTIKNEDLEKFRITLYPTIDIQRILSKLLLITATRGHTFSMEAELLLHVYPETKKFLYMNSRFTDPAGNNFVCKPLQYALWAKDWHMWNMLEKHMTSDEIQKQREEMHTPRFKAQNGSYWDCPKEYELHLLSVNHLPSLEELAEQGQKIPTLICVQEKSSTPLYYLYGHQYDGNKSCGMIPTLTQLDPAPCQNIFQPNTQKIHLQASGVYEKLHEEIEFKQAHFVNFLLNAMSDCIFNFNNVQNELYLKIGAAQRKIPMHIVNQYCRPDYHPVALNTEKKILTNDFLPRTCTLADGSTWYPLGDNKAGSVCKFYLKITSKVPTLETLSDKEKNNLPVLFKKINDPEPADFYVLGFDPISRSNLVLEQITDVEGYLEAIDFDTHDYARLIIDHELLNVFSKHPIVFYSLGLTFYISKHSKNGAGPYPYAEDSMVGTYLYITDICNQQTELVLKNIKQEPQLTLS